jgi:hypothetical protein
MLLIVLEEHLEGVKDESKIELDEGVSKLAVGFSLPLEAFGRGVLSLVLVGLLDGLEITDEAFVDVSVEGIEKSMQLMRHETVYLRHCQFSVVEGQSVLSLRFRLTPSHQLYYELPQLMLVHLQRNLHKNISLKLHQGGWAFFDR